MNPLIALLIGTGYGFLAGNPMARKRFMNGLSALGGKGVDVLNHMNGGDMDNVSTPDDDAVPRPE